MDATPPVPASHALAGESASGAECGLPPPGTTRLSAGRPQRDREEVWRWRDPGPFLVEALRWFGVLRR